VFPSQNPGYSTGAYIAMAIVAALAFFASLLAHELGHAFVALREGMQIDGITLWLFGGVARFKGSFPTAGGEFRIAIAGPIVSLLIGGACVALAVIPGAGRRRALVAQTSTSSCSCSTCCRRSRSTGAASCSALWKARGDFVAATRSAVLVSRGFAFLMIGGGVFLLIFAGAFSGAWLAFVGWFLLSAAAAEEQAITARVAFGDLLVRDLMVSDPVSVGPGLTLGRFMDEVVWARRFTTYPVVDDGRALGLPVPLGRAFPRRVGHENGRRVHGSAPGRSDARSGRAAHGGARRPRRKRRQTRARARRRPSRRPAVDHRPRPGDGARPPRWAAATIAVMTGNGDPVVLLAGVRTAIGRFGGGLKDVDAHELGAAAIREALARSASIRRCRRGRDGRGRPGRA
jgi:Zn-dependent protease